MTPGSGITPGSGVRPVPASARSPADAAPSGTVSAGAAPWVPQGAGGVSETATNPAARTLKVIAATRPQPQQEGSVEVSIELPSGSRVSLETLAGDVQFAGRLGDSRLKTSAGNFWLGQTGALRLKTGFGHVTAGSIAGSAEISAGSGEIKVGDIEGTAVARSSNGAISVGRAGAGVDAKTSNGSIRVGEAAGGPVVLGTPAGDLEAGIAEGTATRLAVSTGHGHVRNLLAGATGPEEAGETVEVRGHTSYGDITIRRSRVAASAIERAGGEDTGSDGASR
ncbi:MAG: DUF4097 family beta strand repeat protein [Actinobacteria bacterium]|nr:DUF4097 family beta strand repeat protein [Actinomycetota bacterium]